MPRVVIPVQPIPAQGSITDLPLTAADATNDHTIVNDGHTLLLVKTGATPVAVTIVSVADGLGRTGDDVKTVAANKEAIFGPYLPSAWNQAGGGLLNVDVDVDTNVEMAALQLSRAP